MKWVNFIHSPYFVSLKVVVAIITVGSVSWFIIEKNTSESDVVSRYPIKLPVLIVEQHINDVEVNVADLIEIATVENESMIQLDSLTTAKIAIPEIAQSVIAQSVIAQSVIAQPVIEQPVIEQPVIEQPVEVELEAAEYETVNYEASRNGTKDTFQLHSPSNSGSRVRLVRYNPWYSKINYFMSIKQETRDINITRRIESPDIEEETLVGTYNATLLSLTAGGNIFKKASFNLDLTLNRYQLSGSVDGYYKVPVKYQRNKSLTELFVEYDLGKASTLGFDLYYGGDRYRDKGSNKVHFDEEMGTDFFLSRKFRFSLIDARLDYVFGKRLVKVDLIEGGVISRSSHNMLASISHNFSYGLSTRLNSRLSYFPEYDEYNYWESRFIYSVGGEVNYRLWNANEISLTADIMQFGDNSIVNMFAIRFEHLFGAKASKRRQRRYKIPNLLIK